VERVGNAITGEQTPALLKPIRRQSTSPINRLLIYHHLTWYRALSSMNTSPTEDGGLGLYGDIYQYRTPNTRIDHRITNSIRGDSNTNVGNVSNSYNNTINVGVDEESLLI